MKEQIERALTALGHARPAFHSEADFQHALAWTIREQNPQCPLRLEVPLRRAVNSYVDILVGPDSTTALELKYHKGLLQTVVNDEEFDLTGTAPRDVARYGFIKDIERLERFVQDFSISTGFALMLTNDPRLWSDRESNERIDREFNLSEGNTLTGHLNWAAHASPGSRIGGLKGIQIKGSYRCIWSPYSMVPNAKHGEFRYLLVQVS